jgi:exopolysaccharide biosynthesis polyprenyl glycosylphosphotransferase
MADRRAVATIGVLGAWDVAAVVLVLAVTGAFAHRGAGLALSVPLMALAGLSLSIAGAYRPGSWLREHPIEMTGGLAVCATVVAWVAVVLGAAAGARPQVSGLALSWVIMTLAWYAGRRTAAAAWRSRRPERVLLVGSGEVATRLVGLERRRGSLVVGCLEDGDEPAAGIPVLGEIEDLPRILSERLIDRVVIAFSPRRDNETLAVLRACSGFAGSVDIVPRFFDFVGPTASIYSIDGLPLLSIPGRRVTRGRAFVKRSLDLLGAGALVVFLSPLLALIALAIVLDSGRPVLFRQRRVGLHGQNFSIIKFRTLLPDHGPRRELPALELTPESIALHVEQAKQEAVRRATRVGAVLRRTSLDELPQLFNVLAGHMSLVGPRPLSPLEDATLEGWELLRREVRPGITGLWQVSGRSEVSWAERVSLDYRQVRHWSMASDLQVLADTIGAVVRQRGAE